MLADVTIVLGLANYVDGPNLAHHHMFLHIKSYWNSAIPIHYLCYHLELLSATHSNTTNQYLGWINVMGHKIILYNLGVGHAIWSRFVWVPSMKFTPQWNHPRTNFSELSSLLSHVLLYSQNWLVDTGNLCHAATKIFALWPFTERCLVLETLLVSTFLAHVLVI